MQVPISEAKARLSELVNAAQSGERVVVTRRGKPVAEIRAVNQQGGIDFEKLDVLRCEIGIADSPVAWPDEFDNPEISCKVLGLK